MLIVTTSFDKKVKLWDAKTGEFLDSLQQNYNKSEAIPIAYYNTKNSTLYSSDLKNSRQI
jgi:WD40 repeat protein